MSLSLNIIKFCAEEIERQMDSPATVADLCNAYDYALQANKDGFAKIRHTDVTALGYLSKPEKNNIHSYRSSNVRVGNHFPPDYQQVERLMGDWLEAVNEGRITAEEAYKEFELIHPFRDGNGRVGKILYNWLNGTLNHPLMPPNFFNCANF